MSAYLMNIVMGIGGTTVQCSVCSSLIIVPAPALHKFCWNCGVKFGPEPKLEPTAGDWWYNPHTGRILFSRCGQSPAVVADVSAFAATREQDANGYLMAASKKLKAACKVISLTPGIRACLSGLDPKALQQIEEAIVSSEPPR